MGALTLHTGLDSRNIPCVASRIRQNNSLLAIGRLYVARLVIYM